MNLNFLISILFIAALQLPNFTSAQETPGKPDSLYSETLKEQRKIQVVLPPYHKPGSDTKYDVVYLI